MRFCLMLCAFFLCINITSANPLGDNSTHFDIKQANQQFDHLNLQLSVQNLELHNLNRAIATLSKLVTQANQCIDDAQKKITSNDLLIQQGSHTAETKTAGADLVYLNLEQQKLANRQAECRLFSIRAKEAIDAYQTASAELKQEEALTRELPLWTVIMQLRDTPVKKIVFTPLQLNAPLALHSLLTWGLLIGASLLIATLLLLRVHHSRFARRYLRIRKTRVSHVLLLSSCLIIGTVFCYLSLIPFHALAKGNILLAASQLVFLYLSALMLVVFTFKLKKVRVFFYWYSLDNDFFRSLILFLFSFYALSLAGRLLANTLIVNQLVWQFGQSLFLLTMLATAGYFIYYFCRAHRHFKFIKHHYYLITRLCSLLLIICAIINITGYHTLAKRLTFSGFITFAIIFITILIIQGINNFYLFLGNNPKSSAIIIKYFGYKKDQHFTEFLILKTTAQVIVVATTVYLIGQSWGFATYYIESAYTQFLYGIHFGNFSFYPTRIVAGVVVFCLLYLLFRSISTALSGRQQFDDEEETQVAIASILTYLGFGLAMISGLLVAGFDFTGLAIVAGALSVGIGLGLQSIVNNFVSGLILLIEKPIKPGDRINVDGVEGTVKKIRVRSTQIITPAREDIIVPNSDLITRRVTNYMYSDKHLSISCQVGVAYGSDTQLVKDILLSVANKHDEVIKTGSNKPSVLFCSFGESTLVFQVWCLIKDANKKSSVKSDLNFAIDRLFREHHVSMAFPQRDIHIKLAEVAEIVANTTHTP